MLSANVFVRARDKSRSRSANLSARDSFERSPRSLRKICSKLRVVDGENDSLSSEIWPILVKKMKDGKSVWHSCKWRRLKNFQVDSISFSRRLSILSYVSIDVFFYSVQKNLSRYLFRPQHKEIVLETSFTFFPKLRILCRFKSPFRPNTFSTNNSSACSKISRVFIVT